MVKQIVDNSTANNFLEFDFIVASYFPWKGHLSYPIEFH